MICHFTLCLGKSLPFLFNAATLFFFFFFYMLLLLLLSPPPFFFHYLSLSNQYTLDICASVKECE